MRLPRGIFGFLIYTALLLLALALLPREALNSHSRQFIFIIGGLALWRYGWGLTHYLRHLIYRFYTFPRWRSIATTYESELLPSHIYFLITSFRIEEKTTLAVYRAALREASACAIPSTVIASIVDDRDEELVKSLYDEFSHVETLTLRIIKIPGTGKRDALAQGFRAISRSFPSEDALVAVIDGDSVLSDGLIRKCVPFFKTMPNLGALTTDEICQVEGSRMIREWHDMRFAQRQILMCSLALSRKVLTLTGRMSIFRADIVTDRDFIHAVQEDKLDHWRLGEFKMLTGDDKSSWYWVLKNGWDMIYVPDATVMTIEHPPHANFFKATTMLMFRWFGNMLRTNGRALKLGPAKMGFFTWWCLLDQRISMWTSLSGPVFVLFIALKHSLAFLPVYIVWIGLTRWIMTILLVTTRPVLSAWYPFLLFYNQIWGSMIKTYVMFRLDRQSWTRQKTSLIRDLTSLEQRWQNFSSALTHSAAAIVFILVIGILSGVISPPDAVADFLFRF